MAAKAAMHLAHTFLYDALHRAAPARVKHADHVPPAVHQNHGQTVGDLNPKQQTGSRGDHPITAEWFFRNRVDAANDVGMNLAQGNERPRRWADSARATSLADYRPQFTKKTNAVPFHRRSGVVFSEAKVEIAFAVSPRESTRARRKTMHQPRKFTEMLGAKNNRFGLDGGPGRHSSMVPESNGRADSPVRRVCFCSLFLFLTLVLALASCFCFGPAL